MIRLNNHERELWVNNDQYLYNTFNQWKRDNKRARKSASMREFLRQEREMIDDYIRRYLSR
jgi:hypothetical protein